MNGSQPVNLVEGSVDVGRGPEFAQYLPTSGVGLQTPVEKALDTNIPSAQMSRTSAQNARNVRLIECEQFNRSAPGEEFVGPQLRAGCRSRDADLTLGQYSSVVAPAHRPSDSEAETAPAPADPPSPSGERQSVPEHGAGRHIPALLFLPIRLRYTVPRNRVDRPLSGSADRASDQRTVPLAPSHSPTLRP